MTRPNWWIISSVGLAALSFGSLIYILTQLWPNPDNMLAGPQLLLYTFTFLGFGTATVPIAAYLNKRFAKPGWADRDKVRLARQGAWVGLYVVLVMYLWLVPALTWTIALVLLGVLLLIELFFLTRE